ncbi:CLUMA_CG018175, isoform A [Clunio marinus]|uniref:CLUMA_CG018175, isoform A n=1 Tax=Clunio marinus TaxID=568069 RepID=A0A1J1IZA5_9DIPT|nr:CLUMA_CG018175, isoform A [Clunio marinus]
MDTVVDESAGNANLASSSVEPPTNDNVDVGENPSLGELGILSDGPASFNLAVGPPSPLTGCYLLIVIGEPYSIDHKDIILQKLLKGLLSWSSADCHVNLEEELNAITNQGLEGEEGKNGERLIQYASENLVTEILIHPQTNTFIQCMRNLLSSFTRHRHIIHAGYTFTGNGSWILQDGTFSVLDFCDAFLENEVQRVLRAYPNTITIDIHCAQLGHWSSLPEKNFTRLCKIRINPEDVLDSGNEKLNAFTDYLSSMVRPGELFSLLESSEVVGNIRFSHPTLYVFPGGQGDSALFGINGFNMLVDGGFPRKACFWDFVRHLDRLDAVLMTRLNNSNICGMSSVIERKSSNPVYPQIGHFFANIPERRAISSPDGDKDRNPLELSLMEEGNRLVSNLKTINLKPQTCYRDNEPINLYHKVGHGTLDMYIISPSKESKEVKDFLKKWHANDHQLFAAKDSKEFNFPAQNLVSICALLVWQPANPEDNITRILFPGSTPSLKIFEGLDKVKALEFLKHPICTVKTVTPSLSTNILSKKSLKAEKLIESQAKTMREKKMEIDKKAEIEKKAEGDDNNVQPDNRLIEEQTNECSTETKTEKTVIKTVTKSKASVKQIKSEIKQTEVKKSETEQFVTEKSDKEETEIIKSSDGPEEVSADGKDEKIINKKDEVGETKPKARISRPKADMKSQVKSRIDSKPPKSMDKKTAKKDEKDQKSSPTTPKKVADSIAKVPNGTAVPVKETSSKEKEAPVKAKVAPRLLKASPKSTPAKSTKDANNRKVLEARQKPQPSAVTKTVTRTEETSKKEIKSVAKRTIRKSGSPMKVSRKDAAVKKASKLDKNGTTDSSLVSTPSADDVPKKVLPGVENEPSPQKELIDLKEEQDAVREIEAVFEKDQSKKQTHGIIMEHRELHESTTEVEEEEEYLIIEKEEPYTEDSINGPVSQKEEEDVARVQRDSDDSEKKLKDDSKEKEPVGENEEEIIQVDDDDEKNSLVGEIKIEVQEILTSATKIAKSKMETSLEGLQKTEEMSAPSPDDKLSSNKRTSETKEDDQKEGAKDDIDPIMIESQPEEKFSATSGATTAPTMPEDEVKDGPPLDEIKEDLAVEEKYIKEETKESEVVVTKLPVVLEPLNKEEKVGFTAVPHLRDIVKTPDEVADLPMHEEVVDYQGYVEYSGKRQSSDKQEAIAVAKQIETEGKEALDQKISLSDPLQLGVAEKIVEKEIKTQRTEIASILNKGIKETHITTVQSPVTDEKVPKFEDVRNDQKPSSYKIEEIKFTPIEDVGLNDIKEEDEHGVSPPPKQLSDDVERLSASPKIPRARTPEDVMAIVSKVAEVLKTDKDLEEIISGFDEQELERRLSAKPSDEEEIENEQEAAPTVQRMLVTASSEDGGVETEICPQGTINFAGASTPEKIYSSDAMPQSEIMNEKTKTPKTPPSSGKSSPELKTSTLSVEEKEKNEIPEKESNLPKTTESFISRFQREEHELTEIRRESAISMLSEKDYTKDESSIIIIEKVNSRSQSITSNILDLDHDEHDHHEQLLPTTERSERKDSHAHITADTKVDKIDDHQISAQAGDRKESIASATSEKKGEESKEASRPASQASAISEKSATGKADEQPLTLKADDRKESIASKKGEESKEASRPASQASAISEKSATEKADEQSLTVKADDRKESIASVTSEKKGEESKETSRPASQASAVSEKSATEKADEQPLTLKADDRKESIASVTSEKKGEESKETSRPASQASAISEKSATQKADEQLLALKADDRKESIASVTSEKKGEESKEASRPASQASAISEKSATGKADEQPLTLKADDRKESIASVTSEKKGDESKEASRPASQASAISEKSATEKADEQPLTLKADDRKESIASVTSEKKGEESKEASRPASQASAISEKSSTEKADGQPLELKADDRKESINSVTSEKKGEESKEASRPASQASAISEKSATEKADEQSLTLKADDRRESIASVTSEKKGGEIRDALSGESVIFEKCSSVKISSDLANPCESNVTREIEVEKMIKKESTHYVEVSTSDMNNKFDSTTSAVMFAQRIKDSTIKDLAEYLDRPESPSSVSSDKNVSDIQDATPPKHEFEIRRKSSVSVASDKSFVYDDLNRPESPPSIGSQGVSKFVEMKSFERPDSPLSVSNDVVCSSEKDTEFVDTDIRRKSSISLASNASDRKENFSRPETPLSATEWDSHFEEPSNLDSTNVEESEDRRESVSKAEKLFESRKESQKSFDDSLVSMQTSKTFEDSEEKIFIKESRSKSVSSIGSTSSRIEDFGKLSAIEEFLSSSKDEINFSSKSSEETLSQKSVKAAGIPLHTEEHSEMEIISTSSFPLLSDQELKVTSTSFPIHEHFTTEEGNFTTTSTHVITTQQFIITETLQSSESLEGKTTPPTIPSSPNLIIEKVQKVTETVGKVSGISTPKGSIHSGKSSPDSAASKSIAFGQGSIVEETPDSSPKPTSPFPKTIDALKSEDDHKTSSGISTPDMTRTSTPDTTEKFVESSKTTSTEKEVKTFTSKVHTQDYTFKSDKDISKDILALKESPQAAMDSYHSQLSTSFKNEEPNDNISGEQHFIYEGDEDEIPPQYEEVKSSILVSSTLQSDPMSTSFYGSLPASSTSDNAKSVPIPIKTSTTVTRTYVEYESSPDVSSDLEAAKRSIKVLDEADLDFEKVFKTQSKTITTVTTQTVQSSSTPSSSDVVESSTTTETVESSAEKQDEKLWEKPLGLPSPAPQLPENGANTTPKRERKILANKNKLNLQKRSNSPMAGKKLSPIYMDLAYVPHHGNLHYSHVEFFKKIRARYYVFSGTEPSKEVYNALLEAKQTWEDQSLEVTIIPTYDTDVLGYWVSENEELLAKYHIDLSPSAARCTINLQDHETSCSAYRLEF